MSRNYTALKGCQCAPDAMGWTSYGESMGVLSRQTSTKDHAMNGWN